MGGSSPPPRSSWSWSYRIRRNSESEVRPRPVFHIPSPGSRPASQHGQGNVSIRQIEPDAMELYMRARERERADSRDNNREQSRDNNFNFPPVSVLPVLAAPPIEGAKNNHNRRSMQHPPLSYYNRGRSAHQRAYSASAAFNYSSDGDDDSLRSPTARNRNSSTSGPPVTAPPGFFGRTSMPPGTMPFGGYSPRDQEFVLRTQRASARIQEIMDGRSTLQAPKTGPRVSADYVPMAYAGGSSLGLDHRGSQYHRQRAPSNSSASTSTGTLGTRSLVSTADSLDSRPPSSSSLASSRTSLDSSLQFGSHDHSQSPRTPTFAHYQIQNGRSGMYFAWRGPSTIKARRRAQSGELFAALPAEVLELILDELRNLHFHAGSDSCATCWMRDCCSVAISARKFLKYAREALYRYIFLVGDESHQLKKRTKANHGARLILLRRTLRANLELAVAVRSLKPPITPSGVTSEKYNDMVASVVMACPNLERLVGFYPTYNHSFQRLFHALSTRPRLKEMNWIMDSMPMPFEPQHRHGDRARSSGGKKLQVWARDNMSSHGPQGFLHYHLNWKQLHTLVIHGQPRAITSTGSVLERIFKHLPALKNLILSHLPASSFDDANLLSLPALNKLSLSHLPGVSTAGLSSMATRSASSSIMTLTLIHINVESLPALARMFSNLSSLETFNIAQAYAPAMPTDEFIWLFPYLASQSLRKLHWDIPHLPTRATVADNILAKSISANGFPALRILRAPNDPEGIFQSLCRPEERADLPTDRFRNGQPHLAGAQAHGQGHGRPGSGYSPGRQSTFNTFNGGVPGTISKPSSAPNSPLFSPDSLMLPHDSSNLHQARLAAQARLDASRRFPRYFINVIDEDEDNAVVERFGVGTFLGSVESKIIYTLKPDPGGTDEDGGLVTVSDLLGDCGEALVLEPQQHQQTDERPMSRKERKKFDAADLEKRTREGCTGRWNTMGGIITSKKEKERQFHIERGRWRDVALS